MQNVSSSIKCLDGMNRFDVWDSNYSINISGNITVEIPDIVEEPELEDSSIEGFFPIVIGVFVLLILFRSVFLWAVRENETIELSPWEAGGILDANKVESEDSPRSENMDEEL